MESKSSSNAKIPQHGSGIQTQQERIIFIYILSTMPEVLPVVFPTKIPQHGKNYSYMLPNIVATMISTTMVTTVVCSSNAKIPQHGRSLQSQQERMIHLKTLKDSNYIFQEEIYQLQMSPILMFWFCNICAAALSLAPNLNRFIMSLKTQKRMRCQRILVYPTKDVNQKIYISFESFHFTEM